MNPRWRMAAILQKKIEKNRHILATARPIVTKFGKITQTDPVYRIGR